MESRALFHHVPVLLSEVLQLLEAERGGVFVDGTLGGGGHAEALLSQMPQNGRLFGIDRDPAALSAAGARLAPYGERFIALRGNFFDMRTLLSQQGITSVDGILLDLGVSSHQLDVAERGFSYKTDAPLDMRMDTDAPLTAALALQTLPEAELARIFFAYGEERFSRRIAKRICERRTETPFTRTAELAQFIASCIPHKLQEKGQHPARRCFQALRIYVNGELDGLPQALENACALLNPGGRLAVISFHSLEDRIVKQHFRSWENPCTCDPHAPMCNCGKLPLGRVLTRKPLVAGTCELDANSRASCAKLRGFEKI